MNCPSCHLALASDSIGGVDCERCGECHGRWIAGERLPRLVELTELELERGERETMRELLESAGRAAPRGQIQCPICRVFMEQLPFDDELALLVDRCPDHGLWLCIGAAGDADEADEAAALVVRKLAGSGSPR